MMYKVDHSEKTQYNTKISFEISIHFTLILYRMYQIQNLQLYQYFILFGQRNVNMTGR